MRHPPFFPVGALFSFHRRSGMPFLGARGTSNLFGLASLLISFMFGVFISSVPSLSPNLVSFKIPIEVPATVLFVGLVLGLIAAMRGSRWWFLALLGPLLGAMFLLSLRT
jgi:hypothetical protein